MKFLLILTTLLSLSIFAQSDSKFDTYFEHGLYPISHNGYIAIKDSETNQIIAEQKDMKGTEVNLQDVEEMMSDERLSDMREQHYKERREEFEADVQEYREEQEKKRNSLKNKIFNYLGKVIPGYLIPR